MRTGLSLTISSLLVGCDSVAVASNGAVAIDSQNFTVHKFLLFTPKLVIAGWVSLLAKAVLAVRTSTHTYICAINRG